MVNPLFDSASPRTLAEKRQLFEIKGKIEDFDRLCEIIEADLGALEEPPSPASWRAAAVDIRLDFAWADLQQKVPAVEGQFTASIAAVCQRCLQPFELKVETQLQMLLTAAGSSAAGHDDEVWEYEGDTIRPLDIVEEALIMALPLAAVHESQKQCGLLVGGLPEEKSETIKPFADLRSQMDKLN